jgi:predicted CXXCH cytochrome family protein
VTRLCVSCHPDVAAQFELPSHHPLREGMVSCTDCHAPHGERRVALGAATALCTGCHQDHAGPWIYEHPPVTENCGQCHAPHGTSSRALLETNEPGVCISCHTLAESGAVPHPVCVRHALFGLPLGGARLLRRSAIEEVIPMSGRCALGLVAILLLIATAARAEEVEQGVEQGEAPAEKLHLLWSITPTATYHWVEQDQEDDDHETGFFDQYEFVPNKSTDFPFQIGVGDASLDLLGPRDTPLLQFRLESPTSNLGVSGSQISDPFFNQRALLLGRLPGFDLDLRYRRMRTEDTRVFPNTAGAGLLFDDRSSHNERFEAERTGFDAELRTRLDELFSSFEGPASRLRDTGAPELSLRGGYQVREGDRQLRFLVEPTNQWIGLAQHRDQEVGTVGGGVVLAPDRLITLDFDFDHQRFRENESTILQSALGGGVAPTNNTIGFIPDTDRYTGTARFRSRLAERAVLEGGLQLSGARSSRRRTPFQHGAGLRDNRLYYSSANVTADVNLIGALSANGYFKFDQRDNDIERHTALFDDAMAPR